jgi:hypothetical protein
MKPSGATVAVKASARSKAVKPSASFRNERSRNSTVAMKLSGTTVAVKASVRSEAVKSSASSKNERSSGSTVAVKPSGRSKAVKPSASFRNERSRNSTVTVKPSGHINCRRDAGPHHVGPVDGRSSYSAGGHGLRQCQRAVQGGKLRDEGGGGLLRLDGQRRYQL